MGTSEKPPTLDGSSLITHKENLTNLTTLADCGSQNMEMVSFKKADLCVTIARSQGLLERLAEIAVNPGIGNPTDQMFKVKDIVCGFGRSEKLKSSPF